MADGVPTWFAVLVTVGVLGGLVYAGVLVSDVVRGVVRLLALVAVGPRKRERADESD